MPINAQLEHSVLPLQIYVNHKCYVYCILLNIVFIYVNDISFVIDLYIHLYQKENYLFELQLFLDEIMCCFLSEGTIKIGPFIGCITSDLSLSA